MKDTLKKWYNVVVKPYAKDVGDSVQSYKYSRHITTLLFAALVIVAGLRGYWWWTERTAENAQKSFSECMYAYDQAISSGSKETWSNVAMLFKQSGDQNSSSSLAPYFKVFYADAILRADNTTNAVNELEESINAVPQDSSMKNIYMTKLALAKIDSDELSAKEDGLKLLEKLAYDDTNTCRDMALYYLGLYRWSKDNIENAKEVWSVLVDSFKKKNFASSPWAQLAESKLEQIS